MSKQVPAVMAPPVSDPSTPIELKADEEITITLKGSTVIAFAQLLEEAPLPRKVYAQLSSDFGSALQKAKAPK